MEKSEKLKQILILVAVAVVIATVSIAAVMITKHLKEDKPLQLTDFSVDEYIEITEGNGKNTKIYHLWRDRNSTTIYITENDSRTTIKNIKGPKEVNIGVLMTIRDGEELSEITGEDITKKSSYTSYTWIASIADSEKYLKYLNDTGYECERTVKANKFIEKYYKNRSKDSYKRVIITQKTISVVNIDDGKYPDIEEYAKN